MKLLRFDSARRNLSEQLYIAGTECANIFA
jgi:hypothetical protein